MYFNEKAKPETKVSVMQFAVPRIGIKPEALSKMQIYVDECSDEIGWLGTATRNEDNFITIHDVFLFDQEVHATTTEITPEGLSDFAEELLQREDGIEVWNNMKVWGHSHVNMGVTPSSQDNTQMNTFAESGHDWFIRIIANKKGEMKIDLYDYTSGVVYLDLPWNEIVNDDVLAVQREINRLMELLESHQTQRVKIIEEPIKAEMKDKVRKKTYGTGYYQNGKWTTVNEKKTNTGESTRTSGTLTTGGDKVTGKKKENENAKSANVYEFPHEEEMDLIQTRNDVHQYFSDEDLVDISLAESVQEVRLQVEEVGYINFFTVDDLIMIWECAQEHADLHIR